MKILNAPEGEKLLTLDPPGGLVGRSADSALVLGYDSVSRLHAELRHDGKDWWLHHRSQTSATLLDGQPLAGGTPRRLGPRGSLQFGRVVVEYHQQALPATPPPPVEPLAGELTLVLPRRASVIFSQALLSQMSPVRVDAPEPAGPPPTLTRLPLLAPSAPLAAAKPSPQPPASRPSQPPPPADLPSPPTLIRPNRTPPPADLPSPPTLVRPNRPLPAELDSPPTLMRTNRPPPPADLASPPTLIRTSRQPTPAAAESGPPPTMIRRNQPPPVPPAKAVGPAPVVRPAPRPAAQSGPMAAAQRLERAAAPLVEHQHDLQPAVAAANSALLAQLQAERDGLRRELEQATAEATRLKQSEKVLQEAKAALGAELAALQAEKPAAPAVQPTSPELVELREKALELLQPFSRSLEQAGEALRKGTAEEARAYLRSASFALADLRDLFQS